METVSKLKYYFQKMLIKLVKFLLLKYTMNNNISMVYLANHQMTWWKIAGKSVDLSQDDHPVIRPSDHRRTGRGVRGGSCSPPQFVQFVDINSGRESTLFGQNNTCLINTS